MLAGNHHRDRLAGRRIQGHVAERQSVRRGGTAAALTREVEGLGHAGRIFQGQHAGARTDGCGLERHLKCNRYRSGTIFPRASAAVIRDELKSLLLEANGRIS